MMSSRNPPGSVIAAGSQKMLMSKAPSYDTAVMLAPVGNFLLVSNYCNMSLVASDLPIAKERSSLDQAVYAPAGER